MLGSPLATNEEAALLTRLAREVIGTPHLDHVGGPVHRAVAAAFTDALGSDRLTSTYADIEHADTVVVVGGDIEESHQVISLRVKDAVVKRGAKLVLISSRWGELVDFAEVWLQPAPGHEALTVQQLAHALDAAAGEAAAPAGVDADRLAQARELIAGRKPEAPSDDNGASEERPSFAVVFAPDPFSVEPAAGQARASANLAIAALGDRAAMGLHYLPTDANTLGLADMGLEPGDGGRSFHEIIEGARDGSIRALLIHDDNPLLSSTGAADVRAALEAVDALVVVDSLRSTAAEHANVVLAELPFFARNGTITSGDRRITRQRPAAEPRRDEREGVAIIAALANALGGDFAYDGAADVMAEAAERVEGYTPYEGLMPSRTRALPEMPAAARTQYQPVAAPSWIPTATGLRLITGRSLYTSWEASSIHSEDADKLHREEDALINPRDAEPLGIRMGDDLVLAAGDAEVRIRARLDDGVAPGTVYVPAWYDGGAVMALFPLGGTADGAAAVQVRALQPA